MVKYWGRNAVIEIMSDINHINIKSTDGNADDSVRKFVEKYGLQADEQQMKVIGGADGAVNLIATAGSGKTRTIINRIGYLTRVKGAAPDSVLAVTFTTAAAREMKERYADSFCTYGDNEFEDNEPMPVFSTINAFCARVVRNAQRKGLIPVMDIPEESVRAFNAAVREAYSRQKGGILTDAALSELKIMICRIKNEMLMGRDKINALKLSDELRSVDLYELYSVYNKILYDASYMDFDDQMRFALRCFVKFPNILEYYKNKYKYIILDESQDTSVLQFAILKMLAAGRGGSVCAGSAREGGIMICGDDDQSIYSFRGASPDSLFNFNKEYENVKTFYLETNYRSKKGIVDAAARLIAGNEKRFNKVIRAFRGNGDVSEGEGSRGNSDGKNTRSGVDGVNDGKSQAGSQECVRTVKTADVGALYDALYKDATGYAATSPEKKIAVLYKNNDSVIPLIDIFERRGAGAVCRREDFLFFSSPVTEDIRSILKVIVDPFDFESFMNMYYKAGGLYINKATAESWKAQTESEGVLNTAMQQLGGSFESRHRAERFCDFMKKAQSAKPADAVRLIVKEGGYENYLMKKTDSETAPRTQMRKVETLTMLAENCSDIEEFLERIDYLSENPFAKQRAALNKHYRNIYFSTIHSAKGLEFDKVLFLDPYQDIFSAGSRKNDEEELRRLFYVGVTRAADEVVFYAADSAYGSENELSDYYYEFTGKTKPSAALFDNLFNDFGVVSKRMSPRSEAVTRYMDNRREIPVERTAAAQYKSSVNIERFKDKVKTKAAGYGAGSSMIQRNMGTGYGKNSGLSASDSGQAMSDDLKKFTAGAAVIHSKYGSGIIKKTDGTLAVIMFDSQKRERTIDLKYAAPGGAIRLK